MLTQECYYCDKPLDPIHYKTIYHWFTNKYFCSDTCFNKQIEKTQLSIEEGKKSGL